MLGIDNKWLIGGGIGVAALVAGFVFLKPKAAASDSSYGGIDGYYPPTVIGSGSGISSADPGGLNASTSYSTDNSISQLIASTLQQSTDQMNTTKYTSDNDKAVALATLDTQKAISAGNNNTSIQEALASQLGQIAASFTTTKTSNKSGFLGIGGGSSTSSSGPTSIVGSIGFDPNSNKININLAGSNPPPVAAPARGATVH